MRRGSRRTLLWAALVLLGARLGGKAFATFRADARPTAPFRRAALLGGLSLSLGSSEVLASPGVSEAVRKIRECEASAKSILGDLSSGASNPMAMTPGQASSAGAGGPPNMGSFATEDGPCSEKELRAAADTLAALAPSAPGLNKQEREKLEDAPKRLVEARKAIVEANAQKKGARLYGAVQKYLTADSALLRAAPAP
eukprot:TRINITY_DN24531_c0_g1_i1.p1 TRINITY_DN24531_c0_g1~~TRINITY_DN24531_c0_g1_i1.p1  ORF type:complete len:198 (-),score=37.45 TRINITY_DN24531_c0_g1_i1:136-729(-)